MLHMIPPKDSQATQSVGLSKPAVERASGKV
uniref:Uncharacterized protein n=1 Tax=Vitis vinifera TaxID=29760 RepID=F6HBD7_VITVI